MAKAATEMELESGWMTWIAAIWLFGSEPITTANFMRMVPYGLTCLNEGLFVYLARLGEAAMSAPEPPPHYFMSHKRENYQRFQVAHPLERFVVLFGELAAYRDDAHIATWHAHRIQGHTWEVLTYLWRGQTAASVDMLFEKLSYRSIPREVYVQDLRELESTNWAQEEAGEYRITAEGKRIREEAEALTDRYFLLRGVARMNPTWKT